MHDDVFTNRKNGGRNQIVFVILTSNGGFHVDFIEIWKKMCTIVIHHLREVEKDLEEVSAADHL